MNGFFIFALHLRITQTRQITGINIDTRSKKMLRHVPKCGYRKKIFVSARLA